MPRMVPWLPMWDVTSPMDSTQAPAHEIVIASTQEEREQCYDVRIKVFHFEQKFPLETEIDEWEDVATHFLLRLTPSKAPIGTIRGFKVAGKPYYKLSRLAVLKEYRKFKFGRELVLALHEWVKRDAEAGTEHVDIIVHSQIPVKGFYARFGYESEGAEFDEDGDPHQKMVVRLPLTR